MKVQQEVAPELKKLDAMLENGSMPAYPVEYGRQRLRQSKFQNSPLYALTNYQAGRIKLALAAGDKATALAACRNIAVMADFPRNGLFLRDGLVRLRLQEWQWYGMELLLDSGYLSDQELKACRNDLSRFLSDIDSLCQRCLFGETIWMIDTMDAITSECPLDFDGVPCRGITIHDLRWILPQLEWMTQYNLNEFIREHLLIAQGEKSNGTLPEAVSVRQCLESAVMRFKAMKTRTIAMQILIDLELHYREHGRYPDALPKDAPLDPYSDHPFHYMVGEKKFTFRKLREKNSDATGKDMWMSPPGMPESGIENDDTVEKMLPVVMVWSVGPNRRDDHGEAEYSQDDIAVMRRLSPSPGEIPSDSAVPK